MKPSTEPLLSVVHHIFAPAFCSGLDLYKFRRATVKVSFRKTHEWVMKVQYLEPRPLASGVVLP